MATTSELQLIDDLLSQHIDLLRLEADVRLRVLAYLQLLEDELSVELRKRNLSITKRAELNAMLSRATKLIDRYYTAIDTRVSDAMVGTGSAVASGTVRTVGTALAGTGEAVLPASGTLAALARSTLILGARSSDWWTRQSKDTSFRFANAVRQGLIGNETSEKIVARITGNSVTPGVMDISRKQARGLVHSSIMAAANESAMATYNENLDIIKGWRQISVLDGHTSLICIAYANAEWDLDEKPIPPNRLPFNGGTPRHFSCRSKIIPILKTFKEQGIDAPELPVHQFRASALGYVKASTTFKQFLKRRTREQIEEQLGKGRADLYLSGKITLQQLLDLKGNPLTLEKLKKRY